MSASTESGFGDTLVTLSTPTLAAGGIGAGDTVVRSTRRHSGLDDGAT
jgi:hypothetical protein